MFRLMIVEDEPIVLEGMLKIINFGDLGYEVVASCSNGKEAFEQFSKVKPDVVITDICMDIMDGLEFIEKVRETNKEAKFVVVSGHQDFKFLKQALSLKVHDYILKPVTAKEFRELLTKIAKELKEQKLSEKKFKENKKSADEYIELHKNIFLNELINMKFSESEILNNFTKHNIELHNKYYQVSIFKANDLEQASKSLKYHSSNLFLNEIFLKLLELCSKNRNIVTFIDPQGSVNMIINGDIVNDIKKTILRISNEMYKSFSDEELAHINCYAGVLVDNILNISNSYKSADEMISKGVLDNKTGFYDASVILANQNANESEFKLLIGSWKQKVIYGDKTAASDLEDIINQVKESYYLLIDYKKIATIMLDGLKREINSANISDIDINIDIDTISEQDLTNHLYSITIAASDKIKEKNSNKELYLANKAIEYIKENFCDINLDLHLICKHLNISVSYFSTVFKKSTKMTFVRYLNNFRITKAKYYLEFSQSSISEISEMVGYVDPHYFGIVFKKYAEITPKKYRALKRKDL